MHALKEQKEIGDKYKIHFFNFFAKLFCTAAEEVITRFGEDAEKP